MQSATSGHARATPAIQTGVLAVPGMPPVVPLFLVGALLAIGFFVEPPDHELRWLFVQLLGAVGLAWLASGRSAPPVRLLVPVGLFLTVACLSAFGAMDPGTSLLTLLRLIALAGVVVVGHGVARRPREARRLLEVVVWTLAAHAVVALLLWSWRPEGFWPRIRAGYPIGSFGHKNHVGEAVAVALVIGFALLRGQPRRQKALLVALGLLALHLGILRARGAWVGAAVAGMVLLLLARGQARIRRARVLAGIVVIAALPNLWFAVFRGVPPGLEHEPQYRLTATRQLETRIARWLNTAVMIGDAPLLGHGPGGYIHAYPRYHRAVQVDDEPGPVLRIAHAHDLILDALAEYGALGLAALLLLAASVLRLASGRDRKVWADRFPRRLTARWARRQAVSRAAAAGLVALCVAGLFGYPFHVPATACLAALLLGILAGSGAPRTRAPERPTLAGLRPAAAGLAVLVVVGAVLALAGSWATRRGATLLGEGDARGAIPLLEWAVRLRPDRDHAHVALATALTRTGRGDAGLAILDRRLATIPTYALGWVHRARLLEELDRKVEGRMSLLRGCAEVPNVSPHCPPWFADGFRGPDSP